MWKSSWQGGGVMIGTSMETWAVSPASLTLLLSDFGLGEMPRPFEVAHPYTTVAERNAFRERTHRELAAAGLLRAGELRADVALSLSTLVTAPVGVVAMGTWEDGTLLARGCWHPHGAVLAWQHADVVRVAELGTSPLVDAIVALVPDARPAAGTSVTVPGATTDRGAGETGRGAGRGAGETDRGGGELFEGFGAPNAAPSAVAKIFSDPVVGCGAFVPFSLGKFLAPVTWFDTTTGRDAMRHFTTTTVDRTGMSWTTYVPGGNARVAYALREIVQPLMG